MRRKHIAVVDVVFVQSLQDDEDDNMEDGIKLITSILGPDNVHLYPSVLQLVMADGAYTEGKLIIIIFAPIRWAKYCDQRVCMSVFVCLPVCLSVRSHISKISRPNFTKFSVSNITVRDDSFVYRLWDGSSRHCITVLCVWWSFCHV